MENERLECCKCGCELQLHEECVRMTHGVMGRFDFIQGLHQDSRESRSQQVFCRQCFLAVFELIKHSRRTPLTVISYPTETLQRELRDAVVCCFKVFSQIVSMKFRDVTEDGVVVDIVLSDTGETDTAKGVGPITYVYCDADDSLVRQDKFKHTCLNSQRQRLDPREQFTNLKQPHNNVVLNKYFWDCECEENYINPKDITEYCAKCDAYRDDQPDSREDEVLQFYLGKP